MLTDPADRCLLFGASGRLGRLCAALLRERGVAFGTLARNGDLQYGGSRVGNLHQADIPSGRHLVIDASIDHGSLEAMLALETAKHAFLERLHARAGLAGLVAFSSGVAEFDESLIRTEWHRRYRQAKLHLERWAGGLSVPAYCPRLFVVIGAQSFTAPTTGWVDVVRQACGSSSVGMGAPDEPRSWVAEAYLGALLHAFLDAPERVLPATPLNGTFSLAQVARLTAQWQGKVVEFEHRTTTSWLSVPYVSRVAPWMAAEYSLEAVLSPLVREYAASLRSGRSG